LCVLPVLQESEAWLLLLLDMLPVLPHAQLLDAVLPLALGQGQVNEPVASRVSCCRLLGAMAPHLVSCAGD
jgi:serine/threonine-protein phosphatase 4 regulatory subunit 4